MAVGMILIFLAILVALLVLMVVIVSTWRDEWRASVARDEATRGTGGG